LQTVIKLKNFIMTLINQLINDNNVDAVYIATPPNSNKFYSLKVAQAGKPCCIEKPLATNYKDSLEIYNTFKEKKLPLFVSYYRRCLPRFNQIKTILDENTFGKIIHVNWQFSKPPNKIDLSKKYNWRTDPEVAPNGYFDDLASHGLDLFTYLLGKIIEAKGFSLNQLNLYKAKDTFTACWLHENGITGSGHWNFGCAQYKDKVIISGSKDEIIFSIFKDNPILLEINGTTKEYNIKNPKHIQLHHVKSIKNQLFNKIMHPSNAKTALHTSCVMDQITGNLI